MAASFTVALMDAIESVDVNRTSDAGIAWAWDVSDMVLNHYGFDSRDMFDAVADELFVDRKAYSAAYHSGRFQDELLVRSVLETHVLDGWVARKRETHRMRKRAMRKAAAADALFVECWYSLF